MTENRPPFLHNTDLDQLYRDIIHAAKIADVPYDKDAIQTVLKAYKRFFAGSTISFVTNTRPKEKRHLSIRYVELMVPHDAYAIALQNNLVTPQGEPIHDMLTELQAKFPYLAYGVDLAVHQGLSKIWVFFRDQPHVDEIFSKMSHLPDSLKQHAAYFKKHNLKYVCLFAFDFLSESVNIYFMEPNPEKTLTPEKVTAMISDAGLAVPKPAELEHCLKALTIYPSFTWKSDKIARLCFGTIAPAPDQVPTHLHPLIENYVKGAPFAGDQPAFIYSITPTVDGSYIKIENDYTCSMTGLMRGGAERVPKEAGV